MQVIFENGYVVSYAIIGNIEDGIEIENPADLSHFEEHYQAYRKEGNVLVFDEEKDSAIEREYISDELRERRETECFAIIDRSKFWYDSLTEAQTEELREWYEAWLNVTDTLKEPKKPDWL